MNVSSVMHPSDMENSLSYDIKNPPSIPWFLFSNLFVFPLGLSIGLTTDIIFDQAINQ